MINSQCVTFVTRDYCIVDGVRLDIVIPAQFIGLYVRDDYILLRAISDVSDPTMFRRFEFLVLEVDSTTTEAIAYDAQWACLGIAGNCTVFVKELFE